MTDQPRPATEGSVMSERMTVEEAWAAHGSIIGLARLARVNGQITAEELLRERDRARAVVKQAILDEGLKEERARIDGLVEAAAYYIDRLEGVLARRVVRDLDESRAGWEVALAAVRALRAVSPTPVEEGG